MDTYRTFRVFKKAGVDVIEEWLNSLPPNISARFRKILRHMEITKQWTRPYFDKLTGFDNLYEILVHNKIQQRLLGCFGPGRREFTLLIGASKSGASKGKPATWNPKNARKLADMRSKLPLKDGRFTDEY
jgi:hypothetical protein